MTTAYSAPDADIGLSSSFSGTAPSSAETPWINAYFRDFDSLAGGPFDDLKNTVELQVTAGDQFYDDPGGSCCGVQGKGHLTGTERATSLYLNLNPALDPSKLELSWTGLPALGFPASGLEPLTIQISDDGENAGAAGSFDIQIDWSGLGPTAPNVPWSKLLFVYDDRDTDIDPADFLYTSVGGSSDRLLAAASVSTAAGTAPTGVIVAVPEPGTLALLGAALFGVVGLGRRKD